MASFWLFFLIFLLHFHITSPTKTLATSQKILHLQDKKPGQRPLRGRVAVFFGPISKLPQLAAIKSRLLWRNGLAPDRSGATLFHFHNFCHVSTHLSIFGRFKREKLVRNTPNCPKFNYFRQNDQFAGPKFLEVVILARKGAFVRSFEAKSVLNFRAKCSLAVQKRAFSELTSLGPRP